MISIRRDHRYEVTKKLCDAIVVYCMYLAISYSNRSRTFNL